MRTKNKERNKKGVKRQFLGVALLSLGVLNAMLSMKAGSPFDAFDSALFAGGAIMLASGILASRG